MAAVVVACCCRAVLLWLGLHCWGEPELDPTTGEPNLDHPDHRRIVSMRSLASPRTLTLACTPPLGASFVIIMTMTMTHHDHQIVTKHHLSSPPPQWLSLNDE